LLVPSNLMTWRYVSSPAVAEVSLSFYAAELRLSPGGRSIAVRTDDDDETSTFHVGRAVGPLAPVVADDLLFVDDDHLLVLVGRDEGTELRELELGASPRVVWQQYVPELRASSLFVRSGRWRLVGFARSRDIVRAEGRIGTAGFEETRWPAPGYRGGWANAIATSGDAAVVVETRYDTWLWRWLWSLRAMDSASQLWRVNRTGYADLGISYADAECVGQALDEDRLVCHAFDGTRTRVVEVDPATGQIIPLATLHGRFISHGRAGGRWLTGWCNATPAALRLREGEAVAMARETRPPATVTIQDHWFGTITPGANGATIRVYDLNQNGRGADK
jgi:hypothetical protein